MHEAMGMWQSYCVSAVGKVLRVVLEGLNRPYHAACMVHQGGADC